MSRSVSRKCETDVDIHYVFFSYYGCRDPFQKCETDVDIRFNNFILFFNERMSTSVSHFSETDIDICFVLFFLFFFFAKQMSRKM